MIHCELLVAVRTIAQGQDSLNEMARLFVHFQVGFLLPSIGYDEQNDLVIGYCVFKCPWRVTLAYCKKTIIDGM